MSPSMHHRSPMRRGSSSSDSPVRGRGSPRRRSSPRRDKSPDRRRTSSRARSPTREKEKLSSRGRSPKKSGRSISPMSRSPSPRSKRLRRAHVERDDDRVNDRERKRNSSREDGRQRERGGDREDQSDRREKRSGKEDTDKGRNNSREDGRHREMGEDRGDQSDKRRRERGEDREDQSDRRRRERGEDREDQSDRREKRSAKEDTDKGSSRSRHRRSASPTERSHRNRSHGSRSPARGSRSRAHDEESNPRGSEHRGDGEEDAVAKMKAAEEALEAKKQKPSFELSGKLAAETNRVKGVTLLFTEPSDARKPDVRWRLYVFKAGEVLNEPLYIHRQSCYLFGRERRVADVPTDHPSCSKQHAVIQFRQVEKEKPDGMMMKQVRPYIMDLGSTNGTFINDNRVEPQRYYELMEKDTIKFGNSSREYVILHENSSED